MRYPPQRSPKPRPTSNGRRSQPFYLPPEVRRFCLQAVERGKRLESDDQTLWDAYAAAHPELAAQLNSMLQGELPTGWENALPVFDGGDSQATRNASGDTLNALAPVIPNLIGGSADLAPSNKTIISGSPDFQPDSYSGRNFRFGVREHGMGAILSGMALHGGVIPYGGTFLVFSDYMRASVRLAALMGVPVIYIFTHDSIGVGEDGPTHQPVEQVAALRTIPNLTVIRPADANEVAQAWKVALTNKSGPTALVLSRQNLPVYDRTAAGVAAADGAALGGYVFFKSNGATTAAPELALISSGSELEIAYSAAQRLAQSGAAVRVVSLPSWELFAAQTPAYQQEVLPPSTLKISIEAGVTQGWQRWVGNDPARGAAIGIDRFGASAPQQDVYTNLGLTVETVVRRRASAIGGVDAYAWGLCRHPPADPTASRHRTRDHSSAGSSLSAPCLGRHERSLGLYSLWTFVPRGDRRCGRRSSPAPAGRRREVGLPS